jgi:hypothetical protein
MPNAACPTLARSAQWRCPLKALDLQRKNMQELPVAARNVCLAAGFIPPELTMISVPDETIAVIPYDDYYHGLHDELFFNLRGKNKREWFSRHAYFCLPLVMGNQHGFAMKSILHATLIWNGGPNPSDTTVTIHNQSQNIEVPNLQTFSSHFGLGIVTVQTAFALRTPPNISLITIQPPNIFIDGLQNMTAVVESDNLRRDFTFNLKLTRPNLAVEIKPDDVIAAVLPYPRLFIDNFDLVDGYQLFSEEQIQEEQQCGRDMATEREHFDPAKKNGVGRRYFNGEDIYGNPFPNRHQKHLQKRSSAEVGQVEAEEPKLGFWAFE